VGFIAGLIFGVVIAAATVALEHYGPSIESLRLSLSGNGAIAAPEILVPLAIFWGWSWIANLWAGRSLLPLAAYTLGLFLGVSLVGPADAFFFPPNAATLSVDDFLGGLLQASLFVGFVAVVAAPIYWVLRSRIGASQVLIWLLYLVSLAIAVIPLFGTLVAGGLVAGVASGHAWQRQGGRTFIAIVVIVIMVLAVFVIPYLLANGLTAPR
jgi:hypothetical protein